MRSDQEQHRPVLEQGSRNEVKTNVKYHPFSQQRIG